MKKIFYAIEIAFLAIITACNSSSTTSNMGDTLADKNASASALVFTIKEFKNELITGCDSCPKVMAAIPVAEGDAGIPQKINDAVFSVVQSILGEKNKQFNNYDSLLANFIGMYKRMKAELQDDAPIGFEGTIKGDVVKQTDSLVNIKLEAFIFTGGAHPSTNTYSLLFNPATGNKLTLNDIVKDVPGLTALAEKKFREQFKIPANAAINSTNFTFYNDKFVLSQNIFFTDSGLLLHYNAYEIAPYYVGATMLTLPFADAQQYLSVHP